MFAKDACHAIMAGDKSLESQTPRDLCLGLHSGAIVMSFLSRPDHQSRASLMWLLFNNNVLQEH